MKKRIIFLSIFVIASVCIFAKNYDGLWKSSKGNYMIISHDEFWKDTEIKVDTNAVKFIDFFDKAIDKPDTPILFETGKNKFIRFTDFFHYEKGIEKEGIVYSDGIIKYLPLMPSVIDFSWYLTFSVIAIISIIFAFVFFVKFNYKKADLLLLLFIVIQFIVILFCRIPSIINIILLSSQIFICFFILIPTIINEEKRIEEIFDIKRHIRNKTITYYQREEYEELRSKIIFRKTIITLLIIIFLLIISSILILFI